MGTTALGAVGLCFPIIVIITAFSNLFGSGGAPIFSINRGKGNIKRAETIMNTSFSMLCICGVALMVIGMLMIPKTCAYVWTVLIGYKTMEKGSTVSKRTKRYSWIIGLLIFITALLLGCIIVKNIEKEKKTAASYTAQSTVKRINAQLDQYVELSEFLENVILAGYNLNQTTFSELAEMLPNEAGVVKAFELAPEGVITDIFPKQGNDQAFERHKRFLLQVIHLCLSIVYFRNAIL